MTETASTAPRRAGVPHQTLSVIIPNYNHAAWLGAALDALLGQTRVPDEIIVVDDASTDDSRAIVARMAAGRSALRLLEQPRNRGPLAAVSRGLAEAGGDFVYLAAADDLVGADFVATSLAALARFPDAAFCFSDPAELDGDTGQIQHYPLHLSEQPIYVSPAAFERLMRRNFFTVSANTVVWRRSALDAIGGLREDLDWLVEWLTLNALAFRHGACYVPSVLTYLRMSRDSYSAVKMRDAAGRREGLIRVFDALQEPEFADVAGRFRRAALFPEMKMRALFWLLADRRHRGYVTPRLIRRVFARQAWAAMRPFTPAPVRRAMRRLSGRAAR